MTTQRVSLRDLRAGDHICFRDGTVCKVHQINHSMFSPGQAIMALDYGGEEPAVSPHPIPWDQPFTKVIL